MNRTVLLPSGARVRGRTLGEPPAQPAVFLLALAGGPLPPGPDRDGAGGAGRPRRDATAGRRRLGAPELSPEGGRDALAGMVGAHPGPRG
jgi:hypothetical protein